MDKLLAENRLILNRFAENGVDLTDEKEFLFGVALSSKEECQTFMDKFRDQYKFSDEWHKIYDCDGAFEFNLSVEILPSSRQVTSIERKLLEVARSFENAEVYWQFKE